MDPLFRYYGSKFLAARHYGPPRRSRVTEPFAGSACYSVWWEVERVRLYDKSPNICMAWDWLTSCSERDLLAVPAPIRSQEEYEALPDGPRQVVGWNMKYASARVPAKIPDWYFAYVNDGIRIGALKGNTTWGMWDEARRDRIRRQLPKLANWTIEQLDYRDVPLDEAHWHVDPPYQGKPGRAYEFSAIDYADLAEWVRSLPGAVDVCENAGADWLPFRSLRNTPSARSEKPSREVVWRNDRANLLDVMEEEAA